MRSLDEWHKYVDIQVKRANTVRSGPAQARALPEKDSSLLEAESGRADIGEASGDACSDTLPDTSFLPDPEPAYFAPTPLPPQIEYASGDSAALQPDPLPRPGLTPAARPEPVLGDASPGRVQEAPVSRQKNGRTPNGARKETREELLARLLDPELTLEEAAQVLNVCPTTVRRYTNRGVLPHYRTIGNQRRFRLSQVLAFLETTEFRAHGGALSSTTEFRAHGGALSSATEFRAHGGGFCPEHADAPRPVISDKANIPPNGAQGPHGSSADHESQATQ